jgi:hypothetical protein
MNASRSKQNPMATAHPREGGTDGRVVDGGGVENESERRS